MIIRKNWNTVIELVGIGVSCIIDQNHVLQISIDDSKIFDVHALWTQIAMLSKQPVVDPFPIRIQIIYDNICVAGMTCCETYDLKMFAEVLQDLLRIGTNVDASIY